MTSYIRLSATALAFCTFGWNAYSYAPESLTGGAPLTSITKSADQGLKINEWYRLDRTANMQLIEKVGGEKNFNIPKSLSRLTLVQGTEVNILRFSKDGEFALIGVDEDISLENEGVRSEDPVIAWVRTSDLVQAKSAHVDIEAVEMLADLGIQIENPDFADTENAARKGGYKRRRGGGGGGMTYCLRDVRIAAARFTRKVPQGIPYASIAYPRYKAAGWRPIAYSSSNPIGTACFFGGGRSCGKAKCGHAAIKIGSNAWKGAGVRPTPFLKGRTLQGCLVPPGK